MKPKIADRVLLAFLCGSWRTQQMHRALHASPMHVRNQITQLRALRLVKLVRIEPCGNNRPRIYYSLTPEGVIAARRLIDAHR